MKKYCWEIIQCDDKDSCPARVHPEKQCWEVMGEHNSFQCHYGLCDECIVFLLKSKESMFSSKELKEVMRKREVIRHFC